MSTSLLNRFTADVASYTGAFDLQHDALLDSPNARERAMLRIAAAQVSAQRIAAETLQATLREGTSIIVREVEQQTEAMQASIDGLGIELGHAFADAGNMIARTVASLEKNLLGSLDELRWLTIQQNFKLDAILDTLSNRRRTEAHELVRQGARHFVNAQYAEARLKFEQALAHDSTDYQVLINLGFLEVRMGNSAEALVHFTNALQLPEHLTAAARSRALLALARLHFAESDFERAHNAGMSAIATAACGPEIFLTVAGYAALAGYKQEAVDLAIRAVRADPELMAAAVRSTMGAMAVVRENLIRQLEALGLEQQRSVHQAIAELRDKIASVNPVSESSIASLLEVSSDTSTLESAIERSSYSQLIKIREAAQLLMADLVNVIGVVRAEADFADQLTRLRSEEASIAARLQSFDDAQSALSTAQRTARWLRLAGWSGTGAMVGAVLVLHTANASAMFQTALAGAIFGPLFVILLEIAPNMVQKIVALGFAASSGILFWQAHIIKRVAEQNLNRTHLDRQIATASGSRLTQPSNSTLVAIQETRTKSRTVFLDRRKEI